MTAGRRLDGDAQDELARLKKEVRDDDQLRTRSPNGVDGPSQAARQIAAIQWPGRGSTARAQAIAERAPQYRNLSGNPGCPLDRHKEPSSSASPAVPSPYHPTLSTPCTGIPERGP